MSCWTQLAGACAVSLLLGTAVSPPLALPAQRADGVVGPAGTHLRSPQTFFAYLEPGEDLDVSFVKDDDPGSGPAEDLVVAVRRPSGADVGCTISDGDPEGSACAWSGLTAPTAGIWAVEVTTSACPSAGPCGRDGYRWDVTVQSGATDVPGRVWSERFVMSQDPSSPPVDISLWYQSEFGYTYRATHRGHHGTDSTFEADNFGIVRDGTCTPAYQSSATLRPAAGACGGTFKLFFDPPAADLPPTATRWNGVTDWIRPPVPATPEIRDGVFAPSVPGSREGTLSFDLSGYRGPLTVHVDVNDDGDHTDPVDRRLPVTADVGAVAVPFDGLDGSGAPVPAGQSFSFEVVVDRVAEIHFVNTDVELRGGGIDVLRLNGPSLGRSTLYWDDTAFPEPDADRCDVTPITDGRAGVGSTGGVHGWGSGACAGVAGADANGGVHGSWGDVRAIEEWTYVPVRVTHTVRAPGRDIRIAKTASRSTARQDDVVTYTIAVENKGAHVHTVADPVELTEDLSGVLDDARIEDPPVATSGTASFTSAVVSWSGPLAPGEEATITYSVRVNQSDVGDRKLVAAVTSDTPGTDCAAAPANPACATLVHVPSLKIVKIADRAEFKQGDTVLYTVTVTNDGQVPFTASDPASFTDDLTDVLDDGEFSVDEVSASAGAIGFASSVLTWTGPLGVGQTASVTYPVAVADPDSGNGALRSTVAGLPGVAVTCAVCEVELPPSAVAGEKVFDTTPNPDRPFARVHGVTLDGGGSAPVPDCTVTEVEFSTAILTGNGRARQMSACAEASDLVVGKQATGTPIPGEDGTFTQSYDIRVGNRGAGPAVYDLAEQLRFGEGVAVESAAAVNTTPGTLPVELSWDGKADTALASAVVIGAGSTHVYRVTVVVTPDPGVTTGTAANCDLDAGEAGTGLRAVATLSQNGRAQQAVACTALPAISVTKAVTATVPNLDGTSTITYEITVTNGGAGAGRYDLADSPEYGAGVELIRADVVAPPAAGPSTGWDGTNDALVAGNVSIDANSSHAYTMTVVVALPHDPAPGALDCSLDSGESGTGARNTARATSNGVVASATACAAFTHLSITAAVLPGWPKANGDATFTVVYQIDVENSGAEPVTYDLTEELLPGKGISVVSATTTANSAWNGADRQEIATGVAVGAGERDTYLLTVVYVVNVVHATSGTTDCEIDDGEPGSGFLSRTIVASRGMPRTAWACAEAPVLSIRQTMTALDQHEDGAHTAVYEIAVTNLGAGAGHYDLSGDLRFGAGVEVDEAVVSAVGDAPAPDSGWDGSGGLVSDTRIGGGDTHVYRVTVTLTSEATGKAADCVVDPGESTTGLRNVATMFTNGVTEQAVACGAFAGVSVAEDVVRATPLGDGYHEISYQITVANEGTASATYSLHDTLRFGVGTAVRSAVIDGAPDWNGALQPVVRIGVPLAVGERHVYTVKVVAAPPANARAESFDCVLDHDEEGTGALNTAAVVVDGVARSASACAPFPGATITKEVLPGSPRRGPDGAVAVDYRITVVNRGTADITYDLDDRLRLGTGTEVTDPAVRMSPDAAPTNPSWNGRSDSSIARGVRLASGVGHSYVVTLRVVPEEAPGGVPACAPDRAGDGSGLWSEATVTVDGTVLTTDACVPFPVDELAATGMDLRTLCGVGVGLLLAGILLVFAARRRQVG